MAPVGPLSNDITFKVKVILQNNSEVLDLVYCKDIDSAN